MQGKFYIGVVAIAASLGLTACANLTPKDTRYNPTKLDKKYHYSASQCNSALQAAYRAVYKARHNNTLNSRADWSGVNDHLAEAVSAQQFRHHAKCIFEAKNVVNYLQRGKHYMEWKDSMRP